MEYHVIQKVEIVENAIKKTPVGYVTNKADADSISDTHASDYLVWINDNLNDLDSGAVLITEYASFPIHEIAYCTNSIGNLNVPLITDLINLL